MTEASHARTGAGSGGGSPWAIGASIFAASVLMIVGFVQFFQGLVVAVDGEDFLVSTPNYVFEFNSDAWGWGHMVLGAIVGLTGLFIMLGNPVARGVGIFIAGLSAVVNFLWIPWYPVWGIVIVALNVLVIWGLATSDVARD